MALPSSGALSIAQIQGEVGGSNPASLSEYYSAHSSVPSTGNPISISDFYGLSDVVTFTYALIGGGGGGGDMPNNKFDSTGFAGEGGGASTRITGTITVASGTTITVTIGGGGAGRFHGSYAGGAGAAGYATITANGVTTPFTSSGTITLTG